MPAAHIMSYAQTLDGGGVERALLRLAGAWVQAERRVTLVVGDTGGPLAAELPAGVALVPLGDRRWRALLRLPAIVRGFRPDVLFCPGNHYTSLALCTRWRLGRATPPIVGKLSNAPARGDHGRFADAGHRAWLAMHGRFLDHLVAMTPATAAEAAPRLGMAGRVTVIPNPPTRPLPDAAPLPLPDGRIVLGVGRLVAQKRWDRAIAALPSLPDDAHLVILGEGERRGALLGQASALGVGARVHLPGHVPDPLGAMVRATVLVLPSDYEGVPGVLREALSVGAPVVATRSSAAIGEIVSEPSLGTVVERKDSPALAAALRYWLDATRPAPVPPPGIDAADRYLRLFDTIRDGHTRRSC